jgi:hypothetical protein
MRKSLHYGPSLDGAVNEPNDVVAAFMRAAYGKGYCDALTEDAPGTLCADHGYRVPARKQTEHVEL